MTVTSSPGDSRALRTSPPSVVSNGAPTASVIIVTWNGRHHLEPCLEALTAQTFRDFEIIVVDNGSTDGTVELLEQRHPHVKLIRNATNRGFAPANNQGIYAALGRFIVTLNNDTRPDPGWLAALVAAAEAHPEVGAVASKMVFAHAPDTINSCGIALDPVAIAWDLWGGRPASIADRPIEIFGACAGAALYRRAMLDDVGLFDDDFFAYLEDVDLAWRAQLRGWRALLAPDARVLHAHSGTLGEGSAFKRYLLARNKVWMIAKCAPVDHLRRWLPALLLYDVGATTLGVLRKRDGASVRGRLAALRGLTRTLRKRRDVQARATVSFKDIVTRMAPLAPPLDVPRRYRHLLSDQPLPPGRAPQTVGPSRREHIRQLILEGVGRLLPGSHRVVSPLVRPTEGAWPRVVVLRPDHLGDVLLSRAAIAQLARSLAPAEVTVVVGPWGAPSLRGLPVRLVTFPFPGFSRRGVTAHPYQTLLALATRLRAERFDAALILRADHWWGAWAAALAGIPVRVGHDTPSTLPFLTTAVPSPGEPKPAGTGTASLVDHLLATLEVPASPCETADSSYTPSARALAEGRKWLSAHALGPTPIIVVHPGSGADLKSWPVPRWAALVAQLAAMGTVLLSAGPGEVEFASAIANATPGRAVPVAAGFPWDGLAGLYASVSVVVGMDSGPLHLATAVGTPTVRVYGPTDSRVFGPSDKPEQNIVLQSILPCAPCGNLVSPVCGYVSQPPCLAMVRTEEVVLAVRPLLAAHA